jgi:AcrR family transcriptional regulator
MVKPKKSIVPHLPPRRGAPLKGEPSARERILKTAGELFYKEGIRAVGIDTVIAESGVSKASLYRTFDSKEELIAAFVAERDRSFWIWWEGIAARHADDPRVQLDTLLFGVVRPIGRTFCRGCSFLNAATESRRGSFGAGACLRQLGGTVGPPYALSDSNDLRIRSVSRPGYFCSSTAHTRLVSWSATSNWLTTFSTLPADSSMKARPDRA